MSSSYTRRRFLGTAAAASLGSGLAAAPFQLIRQPWPLKKITVAVMGIRSRGQALAKSFAAQPDCEVAYLCDVDERYFEATLKEVAKHQTRTPKLEKDIRKVLEDKDIDALVIAAPDHWHAPAAIMALQAGKHVYVEKPCSHNPREGEWLVAAAKKYGRVVQMGNQRRSWPNVVKCIGELQAGVIGKVYMAKGWYANTRKSIGYGKVTAPPPQLDWDLWQGPAPRRPFRDNITPYEWHWFWHWGTGESLNNGTHFLDLMRWGMEVNYPTQVSSTGGRFHFQDDWETPDTQTIQYNFEGGKMMSWESRSCNGQGYFGSSAGIVFYGEGGSVVLGSGNAYEVYDNSGRPKLIKEVKETASTNAPNQQNTVGPGDYYDGMHVDNFLQGIRDGISVRSEIVGAQQSVLLCQLGNIAYRTGRILQIDPVHGHILGDPEAMQLWGREYEPGWEIRL